MSPHSSIARLRVPERSSLTLNELSVMLNDVATILASLSAAVPAATVPAATAPAAEPPRELRRPSAPVVPLRASVPPLTPMRIFVVPAARPRSRRRRLRNWLAQVLGLPASFRR